MLTSWWVMRTKENKGSSLTEETTVGAKTKGKEDWDWSDNSVLNPPNKDKGELFKRHNTTSWVSSSMTKPSTKQEEGDDISFI